MPGNRIEIRGDSSLRKFSAEAKSVEISGKSDDKPVPGSALPWTPIELEMALPVKNLKSDSETLDEHMRESLKAGSFPLIQLKLTQFSFADAVVKASGTLTVAGVTKPIELKGLVSIEGNNLRISGAKSVIMTDFGIEPPTMFMGTVKTQNEIEVIFEVICLLETNKKG